MQRKREPDEIWDAAIAECYPSGVATGMCKEVNGLVRDLKDLSATPAEVHRRAGLYRQYCETKGLMYGLRGLVRRWDQFPLPKPRLQPKRRSTADMVRDRLEMARKDEETRLAGQIIARHTSYECRKAWEKYVGECFVGSRAKSLLKDRQRYPRLVAELLEPGELTRMMAEENEKNTDDVRA